MPDDDDLVRVLAEIQRRGAIGRTSLTDAIAHAERFVHAIPPDSTSLVDLGSGGGLPGLVIAHRRPDLRIALVERRAKRVDLLRFGIRALGLTDAVTVFDADASTFVAPWGSSDVVTARSFGPPLVVLTIAAPMVRPGGLVLVSEPPDGRVAWSAAQLVVRGFDDAGSLEGVRRFLRFHVEH